MRFCIQRDGIIECFKLTPNITPSDQCYVTCSQKTVFGAPRRGKTPDPWNRLLEDGCAICWQALRYYAYYVRVAHGTIARGHACGVMTDCGSGRSRRVGQGPERAEGHERSRALSSAFPGCLAQPDVMIRMPVSKASHDV